VKKMERRRAEEVRAKNLRAAKEERQRKAEEKQEHLDAEERGDAARLLPREGDGVACISSRVA
jgi:hypothetical protein